MTSHQTEGGSPLELPPAEMRRMAERVVAALVERHAGLRAEPPWQGASREEMRGRLGSIDLERPADFDELLDHLLADVLPYAGRIDHPRFMAFVPSSPVWPAVIGEFLAAGYNVFAGTWLASSGPSAVELEVLRWFRDWIGYPDAAAGLLTSGGSAANLMALACARISRFDAHDSRATLYASAEAHSSILRAARILGFHRERVRLVETDDRLRLRPDALARMIRDDRAAGLEPFLVCASAGATSTGAIDPLVELRALADQERLWLHADAAYGGFAVLTGQGRELLGGLGHADSVTLDPHKWLFQPFEAGCLLVRDGERLTAAFHVMPDYLQDTELATAGAPDDAEVNFADRGIQLTRAARALKIYLSVRYHGLPAFRAQIDRTLELTRRAEAWIVNRRGLELLSPAQLGIVCFRRVGESENDRDEAAIEELNRAIVTRIAASGAGMISSTRVRGRYALRLCIMNHRTGWDDVETVLSAAAAP